MAKLLVVDDDQDICLLLTRYFEKKGFQVESAKSGKDAIEIIKSNDIDLVLCDLKLPDYSGIEVLQKIKIINRNIQVIIITGYSDVRTAVESLKKGAFEYVTKPLFPDEILHTVEKALDKSNEGVSSKPKSKKPSSKKTIRKSSEKKEYITGTSPQSLNVKKQIDLIAPTDLTVIIQGETGTGKEYVARAIHNASSRAGNSFVAIDCGALPKEIAGSELFGHVKGAFTGAVKDKEGCFEQADGGTLFLDEIGNLTYENQIKLLRVMQERILRRIGDTRDIPVDVRVLVASNESLVKAVEKGEFREDLYHRLNEFKIDLAPLRERPDDVEVFSNQFLIEANQQLDKDINAFDKSAMNKLRNYQWQGNLRELKNVITKSVLLCQDKTINEDCLPQEIVNFVGDQNFSPDLEFNSNHQTLKEVVENAERIAISKALKKANNNKSKTAEILGVDRKTLYNKLKSLGLD